MPRQLLVPAFIAAALIAAGMAALIVPIVGASNEQFYISCTQKGVQEKPEPRPHPRNCITAASSVHRHVGVILRLDFREISWHSWGSTTAEAIAKVVDPEAHRLRKIYVSVTGRQVCRGLTYYANIVLERPYSYRSSFDLACGSVPEESD